MSTCQSSINAHVGTPLTVQLERVFDVARVTQDWTMLTEKACASVFLSPGWINTWINTHAHSGSHAPWCARLYDDASNIVAMGLFCESTETRHKVLQVRQLLLHATGVQAKDTITIEYNGLLCAHGYEHAAWSSLIRYFHTNPQQSWDELVLPGITHELETQLLPLVSNAYRRAQAGSFHVDLAGLRNNGAKTRDEFLASLSKNTRSQIRRSFKLYEAQGPIRLERAATQPQALDWFSQLGQWRNAKWSARGVTHSIGSDDFVKFHHSLIKDRFEAGDIDILRVSVNEKPIGFLYNLLWRNVSHFYSSGFILEEDNRLKPGLIAQALAIEYYLQCGLNKYDFMGGDDRYKASLGQPGVQIVTLIVQRDRLVLKMEDMARKLRQWL